MSSAVSTSNPLAPPPMEHKEDSLYPSPSPSPPLPEEIPASISLALERAKHAGHTMVLSREAARQLIEDEDGEIIPKFQTMEHEEGKNDQIMVSIEGKKDEEEKHSSTAAKTHFPLHRQPSFISSTPPETVLAWKNLTVKAVNKATGVDHCVLENSSGCITSGLWAVMGPSGCGKSTLLNALACRLDVNMKVSGDIRLNGRPYAHAELKKFAGYVMQDDLLNPHLTVRETLHYTAALRLPRSMSTEQREERVNEVIREMGLTHCQDVIVGDPSKKGVSGGERRRVCIGMELLTRPALLFMDEPTSGLDSVTAYSLGLLLHRLTRTGKCSMVVSIHQPQARLFSLFDRLILLKSGRVLFSGSIPNALSLFEECGFPVPRYFNVADFLLEVITPPMNDELLNTLHKENEAAAGVGMEKRREGAEDGSSDVASDMYGDDLHVFRADNDQRLKDKFDQSGMAKEIDLGFGSNLPLLLERDTVPWTRQFSILLRRNWQESMRKFMPHILALSQALIMGILVGFAYFQIGTSQSSYVRRNPLCFFYCVNQGVVGGLIIINAFPSERALMLRERAAGSYYASAYFLAKITVETLTTLPAPIIFGTISYWIAGMQPLAGNFFIFLLFVILCNLSATSIALLVTSVCKTTDLSATVLPMVLEVSRLFGGLYVAPANLPSYFSWLDALSFIKYSYVGIALNEMQGLTLYCKPGELKNGICPQISGMQQIKALGLDYITTGGCVGALFAYVIGCLFISYLFIRFQKKL